MDLAIKVNYRGGIVKLPVVSGEELSKLSLKLDLK